MFRCSIKPPELNALDASAVAKLANKIETLKEILKFPQKYRQNRK